jgi:hypothetical protein
MVRLRPTTLVSTLLAVASIQGRSLPAQASATATVYASEGVFSPANPGGNDTGAECRGGTSAPAVTAAPATGRIACMGPGASLAGTWAVAPNQARFTQRVQMQHSTDGAETFNIASATLTDVLTFSGPRPDGVDVWLDIDGTIRDQASANSPVQMGSSFWWVETDLSSGPNSGCLAKWVSTYGAGHVVSNGGISYGPCWLESNTLTLTTTIWTTVQFSRSVAARSVADNGPDGSPLWDPSPITAQSFLDLSARIAGLSFFDSVLPPVGNPYWVDVTNDPDYQFTSASGASYDRGVPTVTPEPATVLLSGTGLVLVAGAVTARRRSRGIVAG